jgi:hypothetical protein
MARLQQAPLVLLAALGLSGCLLFTDPINKAPVVTITGPSAPVRGATANYSANVADEDSLLSFELSWAVFPSDASQCASITAAAWSSQAPSSLASNEPFQFKAQNLDVVCLCVQTADHYGATGQACNQITPVNSIPSAVITDVAGYGSGTMRPLCTDIHLSSGSSTYPTGDQQQAGEQVDFKWNGTDPKGQALQSTPCPSPAGSGVDYCFHAGSPGNYNVTLTITDTVSSNGTTTTTSSEPTTFQIPVDVDRPACIQQTSPDVYAQTILLSRSEPPRQFSVSSVADDCDPYPPAATNLQFIWSLFDPTQPSASGQTQWVPQSNFKAVSFPVSQALFPNVRPGDTVKVRLEVRDTPAQDFYSKGQPGGPICPPDTITCYGKDASGNQNDCVRWTTWNVQFQP